MVSWSFLVKLGKPMVSYGFLQMFMVTSNKWWVFNQRQRGYTQQTLESDPFETTTIFQQFIFQIHFFFKNEYCNLWFLHSLEISQWVLFSCLSIKQKIYMFSTRHLMWLISARKSVLPGAFPSSNTHSATKKAEMLKHILIWNCHCHENCTSLSSLYLVATAILGYSPLLDNPNYMVDYTSHPFYIEQYITIFLILTTFGDVGFFCG